MSNNTIQFPDLDFLTPVGIAGQARNDAPDQARNDAPGQARNDASGQARNDAPVKPAMTLEAETGKKVVTPLNVKSILSIKNKKEYD